MRVVDITITLAPKWKLVGDGNGVTVGLKLGRGGPTGHENRRLDSIRVASHGVLCQTWGRHDMDEIVWGRSPYKPT